MLERRLGVSLFDRIGRGVQLSTAGRQLLEEASRLIAAVDAPWLSGDDDKTGTPVAQAALLADHIDTRQRSFAGLFDLVA